MRKFAHSNLVVLALFFALTGCNSGGKDTAASADAAQIDSTPVASETFHGIGVVKNITPSKTYMVIDHQAIPGFMDAMSMPFPVRDSMILRGIHPHDAIAFDVTVEDGSPYVSAVAKREE